MKRFYFAIAAALVFSGCQSKPTLVKTETVTPGPESLVIADLRPGFEFVSFHVPGSVHLDSADYLILKNTKPKKYALDADLEQTIERLARKGLSPDKKVLLLYSKDIFEMKKWSWFLHQLGFNEVDSQLFGEYVDEHKNMRPRDNPEAVSVWSIQNSEAILKKSDSCFVKYSEKLCDDEASAN